MRTAKQYVRILLPAPLLIALALCLNGFAMTRGTASDGTSPTSTTVYAGGAIACVAVLTLVLVASIRADTRGRGQ